jgi:hypothetical protein
LALYVIVPVDDVVKLSIMLLQTPII